MQDKNKNNVGRHLKRDFYGRFLFLFSDQFYTSSGQEDDDVVGSLW
jgi:hypothetical protein